MKVTQKAIKSFNNRNLPGFNEAYNTSKGFHSCAEHCLFSAVQWSISGIMKEPITMREVKEYLEIHGIPKAIDKIKKLQGE